MRLKQVCSECGGHNVLADAHAEWDMITQEWTLANVFDKGAYCDDCEGATRIIEENTK